MAPKCFISIAWQYIWHIACKQQTSMVKKLQLIILNWNKIQKQQKIINMVCIMSTPCWWVCVNAYYDFHSSVTSTWDYCTSNATVTGNGVAQQLHQRVLIIVGYNKFVTNFNKSLSWFLYHVVQTLKNVRIEMTCCGFKFMRLATINFNNRFSQL